MEYKIGEMKLSMGRTDCYSPYASLKKIVFINFVSQWLGRAEINEYYIEENDLIYIQISVGLVDI